MNLDIVVDLLEELQVSNDTCSIRQLLWGIMEICGEEECTLQQARRLIGKTLEYCPPAFPRSQLRTLMSHIMKDLLRSHYLLARPS